MARTPKPKEPEVTLYERLALPFNPGCVEWRAQTVKNDGKQALALAYIDARSVMARLDEVLGPQNWQDSYREVGTGRVVCRLDLRIDGEWISKEDGAGESNMEGEKGAISGAFKRAAVKWGVGRYLYDVDAVWVDCISYKRNDGKYAFKSWSDAGQKLLDSLILKAPPPRVTGRPLQVDTMLDLIREAKTLPALRKIHEEHWAAVPMEYRKEVLEAKDVRKGQLEREAAPQARKRGE